MEKIKEQIDDYIKANNMRRTPERNKLIECIENMKDFNSVELINHAVTNKISKASVYFFIDLLVKIGIMKIQERYVWNKETKK